MGRIRSIHPEQWTDEDFVQCSPLARLLAIAVRNEADDHGVFEWKPVALKMRLMPADDAPIDGLLAELVTNRQVMKFEADGKSYGVVRNFTRFQRPKKPNYRYPEPPEIRNQDGTGSSVKLDKVDTSTEPVPNRLGKPAAEVTVTVTEGGGVAGRAGARDAAPPADVGQGGSEDPALGLIRAFDAAIVAVWGLSRARPYPAGSDIVDARRMHSLGVTPQLVGDITRTRCDRLIATAKAPPGSLRYVVEACVEALADRAKAPNGASAAATSTGQSPDEQWLGRLRSHAKSGQWFRNSWGAPPGEPGCQVPAHVLDQFGAEQPPQAEG